MQLIHFLGGQYFPHGIALNYSEDALYVASQTGNFITKIEPSDNGGLIIYMTDGEEVDISRRQSVRFKNIMSL